MGRRKHDTLPFSGTDWEVDKPLSRGHYADMGGGWPPLTAGKAIAAFSCKTTHTGTNVVWTTADRAITLGGAEGAQLDGTEADLVLDCGGLYKPGSAAFVQPNFSIAGDTLLDELKDAVFKPAPCIRLHWTDRGIPPVGLLFWRKLWQVFRTHFPKGHIAAACVGGHGRTGTCLASLIIADSKLTGEQAIEHIRKHHCERAIEGARQEDYLVALAKQRDQAGA